MNLGDDNGMAVRLNAQDPVAAQPVAQDDGISFLPLRFIDFILNRLLHLFRSPMKGLLQKDEGDSFCLKKQKFLFHNAAGNDEAFHWNYRL